MSDSDPPYSSIAPADKSSLARLSLALGALTDWFIVALLAAGVWQKILPVEPWAYIAVGIGAPSAVAGWVKRLTGKGTGSASATALLGAIASKAGIAGILKGSGILGLMVLLAVPGCASFYSETNEAINTTANTINQAQPAVLLLCQADPGERCDDARKAYEAAGAAVEAAHAANEVVRLTGAGVDEVGKALRKLYDAAAEVANVATQ